MEEQKTPRLFIVVRDDITTERLFTAAMYAMILWVIFRTGPLFTIFVSITSVLIIAGIVRIIYVIRNMSRLKINKAEMKFSSYINTANFILWIILLCR